ncbi:ATP-binding protein [Xanthobacteraceae bacterium A53D]
MARMRVRARAVDMLGRQQIAGIPTAIHELFKNAHDAYADRVRVDYIHSLDLFVLRDNGIGMTRDDLERKWLTLGTESKVGQNDPGAEIWTGPDRRPRRATLGEKGIGRLAIAVIGPQVLVYSRAVRPDGLRSPVCALVNWSLFEQPGIDIDQVEVPIIDLKGFVPPTPADVAGLVAACHRNLAELGDAITPTALERIAAELDAFDVDLATVFSGLGGMGLDAEHGTHFLIKPTSPELGLDLAMGELVQDAAAPLQRFLLGFGNTMHGPEKAPPIVAEFFEHRRDGSVEDLIGPYAFFTPEEFASADHHVSGSFDEFGTFVGKVRIYDQVEHEYRLAAPAGFSGRTDTGPFDLTFAYVQGAQRDTRMPLDEWKRLISKLDSIGGLYIYRDLVRILPYGNSDVDWLNIERRRTLQAAEAFFSYRRLFGDVSITHAKNPHLVEKAGREGFRQNKAYRQMVELLETLFDRLAKDFFRESAKISTDFEELRAGKQKDYLLLQKRAKSVKGAKEAFDKSLVAFFEDLRAETFETRCNDVQVEFVANLDAVERMGDPVAAGERLLMIDAAFDGATKALSKSIAISRPRSFGLTKKQNQDWQAYTRERERLLEDHYIPMFSAVKARIRDVLNGGKVQVDARRRLDEPVRKESEVALNTAADARKRVNLAFDRLGGDIRSTIGRTWSDLNNQVEQVKADLARTEVATLSSEEIERRRDRLIEQVRATTDRSTQLMTSLSDQLSGIMRGIVDGASLTDVTAALESENDELKDRVDQYAELAQIGLALGLVQHEFTAQVRAINRGLEALKPWADRNASLDELYSRLRVSFEHLESYLQLFVPLNRRLHRRRLPVYGAEIEEFLRTAFGPRFERHGISLEVPNEFRTASVTTFPSTLLPVFANLVDNAIYWLGENRDGAKVISLGATSEGLTICNNGPPIDPRDEDRIFEFGISNKPAGRGMGLYLSRDALRKEGMDIRLDASGGKKVKFLVDVPSEMLDLGGEN